MALPSAEAEALNVALPTNEVADPTLLTDGTCEAPVVTHKPGTWLSIFLLSYNVEERNKPSPPAVVSFSPRIWNPVCQMFYRLPSFKVKIASNDTSEFHFHFIVMLLGGGSEDINLDKSSVKSLTASPHVNESKQPADVFPVRRRRPYHGWISDGEDEAELVDVEPPPHSEELQKVLFGRVVWKIRKTRWDLRPEDM